MLTAEVEHAAKRRKKRKEGKSSSDEAARAAGFTYPTQCIFLDLEPLGAKVDSFLLRLLRLFAAERLSPPVPSGGTCPLYAGGWINARLSGDCPRGLVVRCPGFFSTPAGEAALQAVARSHPPGLARGPDSGLRERAHQLRTAAARPDARTGRACAPPLSGLGHGPAARTQRHCPPWAAHSLLKRRRPRPSPPERGRHGQKPPVDTRAGSGQYRAMLGETQNQFSLTRAALSICGPREKQIQKGDPGDARLVGELRAKTTSR